MRARMLNLEQESNKKHDRHITIYDDRTEIHCLDDNGKPAIRVYRPTPTGIEFHADNSFVRLIRGPYGSGKTTLALNDIVKRTCAMPYWFSGRRKARWIIIRNTTGELVSTTLQSWLAWFGDLGDVKKRQKPILTYEHIFRDQFGTVELELMFLALDRPDDVRKLKSLEATGAYLNELCELPQNVLSHIKGRVNGRYPSKSFCSQSYWSGIIADTNPPDEDHWIVQDFEEKQLENYRLFKQPPGLIKDENDLWQENPNRDNHAFLAHDYYSKLAEGQSTDFIKVFCLGLNGSVGTGKIVYPEYNDDLHSVDDIKPIQGLPVYLGWDFGLTPACIVAQFTERGQLLLIKEYTSKDMGIRTFAENVVIPGLRKDFVYNKVGNSVADPAGNSRDVILEELSCIRELSGLGIPTSEARTNAMAPRLAAVRYFLNRMTDGKPAFLISRKGCPTARKGFIKDYFYKRVAVGGEERYKDEPNKNFSSHIHDAIQYCSLEFASDQIAAEKTETEEQHDYFNPTFRYL